MILGNMNDGLKLMATQQINTFFSTIYREFIEAGVASKHLDNLDNKSLLNVIENGGYAKLDNHQLADFYSHSNYVDLMLKEGYNEDNIPLFDELDKNSELYKKIAPKLRTTNFNGHPGNTDDPFDHDQGYKNKTNPDAFAAKDDEGVINQEGKDVFTPAFNTAQRALDKYWDNEINGNQSSNQDKEKK